MEKIFVLTNYKDGACSGLWLIQPLLLHLRKLIFPPFPTAIDCVANSSLANNGTLNPIPFLNAVICLTWTCIGFVDSVTCSVSSYMNQHPGIWKMLFLWSHPPHSAPIIFSHLLCRSLHLEVEECYKTPNLSFWALLNYGSLYELSCAARSFSDKSWTMHWAMGWAILLVVFLL